MRIAKFATCIAALLLVGCATTAEKPNRSARQDEAADASEEMPMAEIAPEDIEEVYDGYGPESADDRALRIAATKKPGDVREMRVWDEADFKRRFAESYMAETDIEPRVTLTEREALLEVMELISAGTLEAAKAKIEEFRSDASSAVFDFILGNINLELEDLKSAAAAYKAATAKYPKFRRAWRLIGELEVREAHFEEAAHALTKVISLGGSDAYTYGMLGVAYSNSNLFLAAESAFRNANLLQPESLDWKLGMARSFFGQQRYVDAVALFDQLIAEYPDRGDFWLAQGQAYAMSGKNMKAAENFEIVDRLGSSTSDSLYNLADIYANEKLHDLAVDGYIRAMKKDASVSPERVVRAAKFLGTSSAFDATETLLDGIDRVYGLSLGVDQKKELLGLRARIALARGADDTQAEILKEIVELDPLDGKALVLLGQHAARTEQPEMAMAYFEQAAKLEAFEAEAKLRHGELLVRLGRYAEALGFLKRAQALAPRDNVQEFIEKVERARP